MTDKRLKEIKDSIDLQLEIAKQLNVDNELLMEEKELYEYAEELKKQLEEKQNPFKGIFAQVNDDTLLRDCGNMNAEINELKTQQKEFINYLEGQIKTSTEVFRLIYKNILQKYKEIIGEAR